MSATLSIQLANNVIQARGGASGKTLGITIGLCLAIGLIFIISLCVWEMRARNAQANIESQVERGEDSFAIINGLIHAETETIHVAPVRRPEAAVQNFKVPADEEPSFFCTFVRFRESPSHMTSMLTIALATIELELELHSLIDRKEWNVSLQQN